MLRLEESWVSVKNVSEYRERFEIKIMVKKTLGGLIDQITDMV
jgi:hypothetical protein